MQNLLIRKALEKHNMKQWELAEAMNINEFSLSRKLRHELPAEEQKHIISLIENGGRENE